MAEEEPSLRRGPAPGDLLVTPVEMATTTLYVVRFLGAVGAVDARAFVAGGEVTWHTPPPGGRSPAWDAAAIAAVRDFRRERGEPGSGT